MLTPEICADAAVVVDAAVVAEDSTELPPDSCISWLWRFRRRRRYCALRRRAARVSIARPLLLERPVIWTSNSAGSLAVPTPERRRPRVYLHRPRSAGLLTNSSSTVCSSAARYRRSASHGATDSPGSGPLAASCVSSTWANSGSRGFSHIGLGR